jgi:PAS domain S-box-containing protein
MESSLSALESGEVPLAEFRLLADNIPTLCWIGNGDGYIVWYNRRWHEYCGTTAEEMEGWGWQSVHDPELLPKVMERWVKSVATGEPFEMTFPLKGADGVFRPFLTRVQPVRDASGEVVRWFGVNTEISQQVAAEERLQASEERFRRIFEQTSDLVITADLNQLITDCNPAAAEAVGLSRADAIGRRISDFISPDDFNRTTEMLRQKLDRGGTTQYDVRVRSDAGEWLNWEINSGLTFDDNGNPIGLHVVGRDVTERKRLERHQQLLVSELNHRVKNTLSIVQSLAHQTFRKSPSPAEAIGRFEGRLEALAAAHNLLTRENWDSASISEVIAQALAPFCHDGRCDLRGPQLRLPPKTAVSLTLAVHELATNASKYGALSHNDGRIIVHWTVENEWMELMWREQDGPPVAPPQTAGFGTRMIKRLLTVEFGGEVELEFAADGVVCRVSAPVPQLDETS